MRMNDDTPKKDYLTMKPEEETGSSKVDLRYNNLIDFIPFAFHLVPLGGLTKVAAVMRIGEMKGRRGKENWGRVPVKEHINHALAHIVAYLDEKDEDSIAKEHHLANAGCRILMALDLDTGAPPKVDPAD